MKQQFPKLKGKAILSPMAGVTDVAFRALCKKYGAALTCTEFVSSAALVRKDKKTKEMLAIDKSESPSQVQLFGNYVEELIQATKFLEKSFDIIDINCGCPAWKVIKTGAGSELLKSPKKIGELVKQLSSATNKPITIKIRKGIDEKNTNAIEVAKIAEKNGASAIAIHGRTQKQGYSGQADWEIIKQVKQSVKIPVIGNGDVFTPEDFKKRLEESRVDYILIARGAMGNPYIFKQINDYLKTGKYDSKPKIDQFKEYLKLAKKHKVNFKQIKNHSISFTKGEQSAAKLRKELSQTKTLEELKNILGI
ncbi:tRNA dihydrouridine synthase DusB [Candidatus Pacearchaeota archaeon CG10_big_fil_rev_8_21_14_0_10_30_48]|nr:MAG: tRNA dihydrouridine synthase DusB [Candidatus Pacearchaeota archaeon CG10_big_fil_rev_8_21_14_0_10_30_48]